MTSQERGPGEHASRTRLHAAIDRLHQLGIGRVLVSLDDGYLLDPAVSTRIVRGAGPARPAKPARGTVRPSRPQAAPADARSAVRDLSVWSG